jgi:predicted nucleic acid-binding protein
MSVLLDTSVWIRHFRESNGEVVRLLEEQQVMTHPYVVAEIACGSLKKRIETLSYLKAIPTLPIVAIDEILTFIESRELFSKGVGFVDVQLLASVIISDNVSLWTTDNRLEAIAVKMGISYPALHS